MTRAQMLDSMDIEQERGITIKAQTVIRREPKAYGADIPLPVVREPLLSGRYGWKADLDSANLKPASDTCHVSLTDAAAACPSLLAPADMAAGESW